MLGAGVLGFAGCNGDNDPLPGTPVLTVVYPGAGTTLRMNRPIAFGAQASGVVPQYVEFAADGILLATDSVAPYITTFGFGNLASPLVGSHTLRARAAYSNGEIRDASVTVNVAAGPNFVASGADHVVYGRDGADFTGFPRGIVTGDVTGDGTADLIVAVPFADGANNVGTDRGEVHVVAGGPAIAATLDLAAASARFTVTGRDDNDWMGYAVATGDLNNDGTEDLIVGVPQGDGPNNVGTDRGEVVVLFGSPTLAGTVDLAATTPGLVVHGRDNGDQLGWTVAAGDVNGDGITDLVMGAPKGDGPLNVGTDRGEVVVIFGGTALPSVIDLATATPGYIVYGVDDGDEWGTGLAVGEVTGNGVRDLLLGARFADGFNNLGSARGEAAVVAGSTAMSGSLNLATTAPTCLVFGRDDGDEFGSHLAAADVDGTGGGDLVVSAFLGNGFGNVGSDRGEVVVVLGGSSLPTSLDLAFTAPAMTVYGADDNDFLGWGLAAGDVDGDGAADLWIGVKGGDGPANAIAGCGEAVLVRSAGAVLPASIDLSTTAPWLLCYGTDSGDLLGTAVAIGDVDGDGIPDILAAATDADGPANLGANLGEVVVLVR